MKFITILCFLLVGIYPVDATEIKILTLNVLNSVQHGGWQDKGWSPEDGKTRGQKVVEVILKSEADIICIQEYIHNNEWIKQELEQVTNQKWNLRILPRNCAIISQLEILPHGNMFLTPIQISEKRTIGVISSHQFVYTYLPYEVYNGMNADEACKKAIALNQNSYWKAIVEEISSAQKRGEDVILTGDFNEPSHLDYTPKAVSAGYVKSAFLSGLMSNILIDQMKFKDAWIEKRLKENKDECSLRGITWSPTTWEYKKGTDDQRIDFIYYTSEKIKFIDAKLIGETPIVSIEGDNVDLSIDRWPSDHRGVLAILKID